LLASKEPAEITATHFTEADRTDDTATVTVDVAATLKAPGGIGVFATTEYRS
jgi:hypothetical protein